MGGRGASSLKAENTIKTTAKNMNLAERVYASQSFWQRNFTDSQNQAIRMTSSPNDISQIGETEKAIQIQIKTDYGNLRTWIPKSVISDEAMERNITYARERENRRTQGIQRNNDLVNYAKSRGVNVRKRMKTSTILKKMREAGIEVPKQYK